MYARCPPPKANSQSYYLESEYPGKQKKRRLARTWLAPDIPDVSDGDSEIMVFWLRAYRGGYR